MTINEGSQDQPIKDHRQQQFSFYSFHPYNFDSLFTEDYTIGQWMINKQGITQFNYIIFLTLDIKITLTRESLQGLE